MENHLYTEYYVALLFGPDGILHLDVPIEVHDAEDYVDTQSSHTNTRSQNPEELGLPPDFLRERLALCGMNP